MYYFFRNDQFIIKIFETGKEFILTKEQAVYMLMYMKTELEKEIENFEKGII